MEGGRERDRERGWWGVERRDRGRREMEGGRGTM